jgi:hypothetical protein
MSQKTESVGEAENEGVYVDVAKPVVKFAVAAGVLVALWWVALNVEATNEITAPIPGTAESVTAGEIISSLLTLFLFAAVLKFSADIGDILEDAVELSALSTLSKLVGLVVGLIFAHTMFGWVTNVFPEYASHYDLAFLIVGLVVGGVIGLVLYMNVDEILDEVG